eukprot:scaffold10054_cov133-Isochrysis_galbana.AAC.6
MAGSRRGSLRKSRRPCARVRGHSHRVEALAATAVSDSTLRERAATRRGSRPHKKTCKTLECPAYLPSALGLSGAVRAVREPLLGIPKRPDSP